MSKSPKVQVYLPVDESGESYEKWRAAGATVVAPDMDRPKHQTVSLEPDTDAAAGYVAPIPREALEAAPDLRLVANYTVGYDNVDLTAATEMGILVTHTPGENNWAGVAEGTMALMLALLKRIRERDRHVRAGGWMDSSLLGTYVGARQIDGYPGLTIGIIGFGRIGQRLADLLAPWRVRVIAYDPYADVNDFAMHNVLRVDFDTLMRESNVVTVHCKLTEETRGLIGEKALGLMKPGAILINTARGPIVDMEVLYRALKDDRIAAAALDVFPEEPPGKDLPLYELGDKVLLSPHMVAGNAGSGLELAIPAVTEAVLKALRGDLPNNIVNPDAIPKWRERFGGKSLI